MKHAIAAAFALAACSHPAPERYGFIARLGRDTVSVESVARRGSTVTSDAVDRFPRVRQRHTVIELDADGRIRSLVMDIRTPSEPVKQRSRRVEVEVRSDSVVISKQDDSTTYRRAFATGGGIAMAHLPQMYSLYELYFAAAMKRAEKGKRGPGDTVHMRQFYIDREFDRFPLHGGVVRLLAGGKVEVTHDWLSGVGEATLDSTHRLRSYSGQRTTYKVAVERLATPPDVEMIGAQFAALETKGGGASQLSVRDTARATIGRATFSIDYGRPLARGRQLLGNIIPYDRVWRTGANAATQFTTSAPITLGGMSVPAGTYTLWTVPRTNGAQLIVNKQTGQWGTGYNGAHDLGMVRMTTDTLATPVERFAMSIVPVDARSGSLTLEWGPFRWTAPIVVASP